MPFVRRGFKNWKIYTSIDELICLFTTHEFFIFQKSDGQKSVSLIVDNKKSNIIFFLVINMTICMVFNRKITDCRGITRKPPGSFILLGQL